MTNQQSTLINYYVNKGYRLQTILERGIVSLSMDECISILGNNLRTNRECFVDRKAICDAYLSGLSIYEILESDLSKDKVTGERIDRATITRILKSNSIDIRGHKLKLRDEDIEEIKSLYLSGLGVSDIVKLGFCCLNGGKVISISGIKSVLGDLYVNKRPNSFFVDYVLR